jgi:uncharacterized alkaline shock family protein YloU
LDQPVTTGTVPAVPDRRATTPRDRGTTTIAPSVVAKIASIATREVEGVVGMGGPVAGAVGQVVGRIRGQEHDAAGVVVEVGTTQAAIDLTVRLSYPVEVLQVTDEIRREVADRVRSLSGLEVVEVNIDVIELVSPEDVASPDTEARVQ